MLIILYITIIFFNVIVYNDFHMSLHLIPLTKNVKLSNLISLNEKKVIINE
jgi:hypothetical protein